MATVIYNGISAESLGAIVLSVSPPIRAARRIKSIEIPGRSGVLHVPDKSYAPIQKKVRLGVRSRERIESINAWCAESGRLESSYEPNRAYVVTQSPAIEWERLSRELHQVEITFECEPFRYLWPEAPPITLTEPGEITNPGSADSEPLIEVVGSGDITIIVGNQIVSLQSIESSITMDSAIQNAYSGSTSLNHQMNGDFPVLLPGINVVSWTGTVNHISITPRWRFL